MERHESFWTQAGQVLLAICTLIGAVVLLVGVLKLFEAAWPTIGPVFWTVVGHGLAWGLFLMLVFIGVMIAVSPVYSTIKSWGERTVAANSLRVIGALVGLVIGLWIVLIAVEANIGVLF